MQNKPNEYISCAVLHHQSLELLACTAAGLLQTCASSISSLGSFKSGSVNCMHDNSHARD